MDNKIIYSEQYVIEHTFTSKIVPNVNASVTINNKEQDSFTGFMGTSFSYVCSAEGYETYKDNGVIGNANEDINITLQPVAHKLVIKTNVDTEDLPNQMITMKMGNNELTGNNLLLYPGEEVTVSVYCPGYRPVHDVNILMGTEDMEYYINLVPCNCSLTFFVEPSFADIKIIVNGVQKYWANNTPLEQLAIGDAIEFEITETGYVSETGTIVIEEQNQEVHIKMNEVINEDMTE
jgi:hypothetical protein